MIEKKYEYKEQADIPRGVGRTTIDNPARRSYSRRANSGKLDVLKKYKCPFCFHHKSLLTNSNILKCSRCKRVFEV